MSLSIWLWQNDHHVAVWIEQGQRKFIFTLECLFRSLFKMVFELPQNGNGNPLKMAYSGLCGRKSLYLKYILYVTKIWFLTLVLEYEEQQFLCTQDVKKMSGLCCLYVLKSWFSPDANSIKVLKCHNKIVILCYQTFIIKHIFRYYYLMFVWACLCGPAQSCLCCHLQMVAAFFSHSLMSAGIASCFITFMLRFEKIGYSKNIKCSVAFSFTAIFHKHNYLEVLILV